MNFFIKYRIKFFILSVCVYVLGICNLPVRHTIEEMVIKSLNITITSNMFNTIYCLFSIPLFGVSLALIAGKDEKMSAFMFPTLFLTTLFYGILCVLYNIEYLISSISLLATCVILLFVVSVDKIRYDKYGDN